MSSPYTPSPGEPTRGDLVAESMRGPVRVIIEQPRTNWFVKGLKWLVVILLMFFIVGLMYGGDEGKVQERWHSLSKTASDKVAVITVEGTIIGDENFVKRQIDHVRDDDHVKAIVLRVDSPGGTVTGSDFLYHQFQKLAKEKQVPLVVSMGSIAASGGYYIAMAAGDRPDTIFAEPTTWTGSIGVIIPHYDFSGLLEKLNVQDDSIASNPLKMMGSPTRKFPEGTRAEEQQILKGLVDSSFEDFKEIVLASRAALREDKAAQDVAFTGRIFTAKQALENHLVDKLGFVDSAVSRAIELASLDKDEVKVVKFHQPTGLLDQMLFGPQSRKQPFDLTSLLDLATPKAYYLCTFMPGLSSFAK